MYLYGLILLYIYIFYSHYNTDWIANTEIVMDPNDSVIKRLRCTKNLKFLPESIYLLSMRYLYRKSPFKNVFDQNFFLLTDFQNFCCTFCDKLNAQLCQENI